MAYTTTAVHDMDTAAVVLPRPTPPPPPPRPHPCLPFLRQTLKVPRFARVLIPTWRRVLYLPRAGCLEEIASPVVAQ